MMVAGSRILTALPSKWDAGAEYVALFPNVLLGVHNDHAFAILDCQTAMAARLSRLNSITLMKTVRGDEYADMRATNNRCGRPCSPKMWASLKACSADGMQAGYDGGKFSAVMDPPTHHFHWVGGVGAQHAFLIGFRDRRNQS